MTEIFFYHLERSTAPQVLPSLLEKTRAKGWRAHVKCVDRPSLEALDDALWSYRDESFLAHGSSGPEEPIFLSLTDEKINKAEAAFLMPGTSMDPEQLRAFERCVLLFGHDDAPAARQSWTALKDEGFAVTYWKQAPDGRWEKAA